MYIGPWQEFALGRALAPSGRRHGRRRVTAEAAAPVEADLAMFMQNFKELASRIDEEGAKNMLRFSPLFMPTMQGLLHPGGDVPRHPGGGTTALEPPVGTTGRAQAAVASLLADEPPRVAEAMLPPASQRRRSSGGGGSTVRAQRQQRLQRLQHMYNCGGAPAEAASAARVGASPSPELALAPRPAAVSPELSFSPLPPPPPPPPAAELRAGGAWAVGSGPSSRTRTPRLGSPGYAPKPSYGASLPDDWEDEVDGLLDWTKGLGGVW